MLLLSMNRPINPKIWEKMIFLHAKPLNADNLITDRPIYPNLIFLSPGGWAALFDTQQSYLKSFCNKIDFLG